jgi:hypothetical protein
MLSKIGCLFLLFISGIQCFQIQKNKGSIYKHKCAISMIINEKENLNDLQLIHKYKFYFTKENYNDLMQDLLNNKLSKILVDKKYNFTCLWYTGCTFHQYIINKYNLA